MDIDLNPLVAYIKNLKHVTKSKPFENNIDVYSIDGQMFALVNNKQPLIVSLRCDLSLAKLLQAKYESVMPGHKLDQDKWVSIVNSGQIPLNELQDLVNLSYDLAKKSS